MDRGSEEILGAAYRAFNARDLKSAVALSGAITVDVHQVVNDAQSGAPISDSHVRHRYRIEDGLILRMDVLG